MEGPVRLRESPVARGVGRGTPGTPYSDVGQRIRVSWSNVPIKKEKKVLNVGIDISGAKNSYLWPPPLLGVLILSPAPPPAWTLRLAILGTLQLLDGNEDSPPRDIPSGDTDLFNMEFLSVCNKKVM